MLKSTGFLHLLAMGRSSCSEIKIIAPAAKAMKYGLRYEKRLTAKRPRIAPAGSASPEIKAVLKSVFLLLPDATRGAAIANSSGILWRAMPIETSMPKFGEKMYELAIANPSGKSCRIRPNAIR